MEAAMESAPSEEYTEDNLFYCRVDTFRATKDYLQGGLCVRFIGIEAANRNILNHDEGVETFIVDVDLWKFAEILHKRNPNRDTRHFIYAFESLPEQHNRWYALRIEPSNYARNYLYSTFSEDPPRYFEIKELGVVEEPGLDVRPPSQSLSSIRASLISSGRWIVDNPQTALLDLRLEDKYFGGDFVLESFHVGQGMCSIVHDGTWGMLLDMGAGKPVLRPKYPTLSNDLHLVTDKLKELNLLMSHFDSDHWRILAWDTKLRNKIKNIYVPSGDRPPVFNDKNIKKKIVQVSDTFIRLAADAFLRIYRSDPSHSDSNGQCLVTTFYKGGKLALAPGDYAYHRFATDANTGIQELLSEIYSAVIVPHHGDLASARSVVDCVPGSPAFFSAGTHQGYNHPTTASVDEHLLKNFIAIEKNTEENIVRKLLM
ncbi:hypothetical protein [Pseudomonas viridiflava]|uniref:hypothetical protein n=1 Tax=Pseudomonas viridiflava TaxID=33069 RepID=UPI0013CEC6ED|nr:hypothetical protein [Pseudomonas viridiflava]